MLFQGLPRLCGTRLSVDTSRPQRPRQLCGEPASRAVAGDAQTRERASARSSCAECTVQVSESFCFSESISKVRKRNGRCHLSCVRIEKTRVEPLKETLKVARSRCCSSFACWLAKEAHEMGIRWVIASQSSRLVHGGVFGSTQSWPRWGDSSSHSRRACGVPIESDDTHTLRDSCEGSSFSVAKTRQVSLSHCVIKLLRAAVGERLPAGDPACLSSAMCATCGQGFWELNANKEERAK